MQTFLPYSSFAKAAAVLDGKRLSKQQTEAEQILNVLRNPNAKGWANHPAVLQWKGYENALELYLYAISRECSSRGYKGKHDGCPSLIVIPPWMGRDDIHDSHKSRLLFKGRVDAAALGLKKMGVKVVNKWLVANGYPEKNMFKHEDIIKLECYLAVCRVEIPANHYRQYWPDLPDNIPYVWPSKE